MQVRRIRLNCNGINVLTGEEGYSVTWKALYEEIYNAEDYTARDASKDTECEQAVTWIWYVTCGIYCRKSFSIVAHISATGAR